MSTPAINNQCPEFQGDPKICNYYRISKVSLDPSDDRISVVSLDFLNKNLPTVCGPCNNPKPLADLPSDPQYLSLLNSVDNYIDNFISNPANNNTYPEIGQTFRYNTLLKTIFLEYFSIADRDYVTIAWPKQPAFSYFYVEGKRHQIGYIRGTWGPGKDFQHPYRQPTPGNISKYTSIFDLGDEGGSDGYHVWNFAYAPAMLQPRNCMNGYKTLNREPEDCILNTGGSKSCIICASHFRDINTCILKDDDTYIARHSLGKDEIECEWVDFTVPTDGSRFDDPNKLNHSLGEDRPEFCGDPHRTVCHGPNSDAYWPWWVGPGTNKRIPPYRRNVQDGQGVEWIPSEYRGTRSQELFKLSALLDPTSVGVRDENGQIFIDEQKLPKITNKNKYLAAYENWVEANWQFMDDDWKEAVFAFYGIVEPEDGGFDDALPYLSGEDPNGNPRQIWLELWGIDPSTKKVVRKASPSQMQDQSNVIRNYIFVTQASGSSNIADLYIGFNRQTCSLEERILYPGDPKPCMGYNPPEQIIPQVCQYVEVKIIKNFTGLLLSESNPKEFARLEAEWQNKYGRCKKACCVTFKGKRNWRWNKMVLNGETSEWSKLEPGEERQICVLTGETTCDPEYITSSLLLGPWGGAPDGTNISEASNYKLNYKTGKIYKDCGTPPQLNVPHCSWTNVSQGSFWDPDCYYKLREYEACKASDGTSEYAQIDSPFEIISTVWNSEVSSCEDHECPGSVTNPIGTCCYYDAQSSNWGCAVNTSSQCKELRGFWEASAEGNTPSCIERGAQLLDVDGIVVVCTMGPRICSLHGDPPPPTVTPPCVFPPEIIIDDPGWRDRKPPEWRNSPPPVYGPDPNHPYYAKGSLILGSDGNVYQCIASPAECAVTDPVLDNS